MAVKIRLARRGRKKMAIYDIIAADSRSPRDGKFIEKLGQYNPNSVPATILLDVDRAVYWTMVGAQPTDTAKRILSDKGVMFKKHLQVGVQKGAITQEVADAKFEEWSKAKAEKSENKASKAAQDKASVVKAKFEAEKKKNEDRATALAAAANAAVAASEAEVVEEEVVTETPATEETPVVEETAAEVAPATDETPAAEAE